ncbi:MAG: RNase P modulator RnpM [Clostridia bacterium]
MKDRKKPQRMCVACREKKDKFDLVRVVKTPDGEVVIEKDKRVNGRGAYLCHKTECIDKANKTKSLDKALNIKVPLEIYDELKKMIE